MTAVTEGQHRRDPAAASAPSPSGAPPPRPGSGRRRRLLGRVWLVLVVVELVFLGAVGTSVASALTAPGTQSTTARIAEWARNNGMSPLVTWAEQLTYQPPTVGGAPAANSPLRQLGPAPAVPAGPTPPAGPTLPATITTPAQPSLPGEGQWKVTATVHGSPAMAQTFLRPDATHTSYTAAATWFDPHLVRAQLHPGAAQPGGTGWTVPSFIPPSDRAGLLAAFNSGFKLADAHGGFYEGGRYAKPLVAGAASMVFYTDGTMTVGQWGRGVTMSPKVAAVRQNLTLLVDHAQVVRDRGDRIRCPRLGHRAPVVRAHPGEPVAARRECAGHAAGHQPGLDLVHQLPRHRRPGPAASGESAAHDETLTQAVQHRLGPRLRHPARPRRCAAEDLGAWVGK